MDRRESELQILWGSNQAPSDKGIQNTDGLPLPWSADFIWVEHTYVLIKQLMAHQRNNSSSAPPMLLPQHVSVVRPSSSGIQ
jgi:hypothetical protein